MLTRALSTLSDYNKVLLIRGTLKMNIIGIKELQTNPAKLSQSFSDNEYMLITKRGKPIGVALPFTHHIMEQGLRPWMALKAFEAGDLSLGQLAQVFGQSKTEAMETLSLLNIVVADYELQEDLDTLTQWLDK